jgi:hypothetical protein
MGYPEVVMKASGWIGGFSRVMHLTLGPGVPSTLIPFHGFLPGFKSLRVTSTVGPLPHILNLTLSFPLLEGLNMMA